MSQLIDLGRDLVIPVANNFIDTRRYKQDTIFVTRGLPGSIVKFETAMRIFDLQGTFNRIDNTLKDGVLYLDVPIWGLFPISNNINGSLTGNGITTTVDISEVATGKFKLVLDSNNENIVLSYDLKIAFAGDLSEPGFNILCLTDERVKNAVIDELADGRELEEFHLTELSSGEQSHQADLLRGFLKDHFVDDTSFVVASYDAGGDLTLGSNAYTFDAVVLSVFEFIGAISPSVYAINCALYMRVPVWGRVRLAEIIGDLVNGVTVTVDVLVARGSVRLFLQNNTTTGNKDLYATINLTAKFLGTFSDDSVKILSLP